MSLDVRIIAANWVSLAAAVIAVVLVKVVVTTTFLRISGARRSTALEAGVVMASPSETTLIFLSAATAAHLILPSTAAFWQIVTAIGLTITTLLAKLGHIIAPKIDMGTGEEPDRKRLSLKYSHYCAPR